MKKHLFFLLAVMFIFSTLLSGCAVWVDDSSADESKGTQSVSASSDSEEPESSLPDETSEAKKDIFASGLGTSGKPYLIDTADGLFAFAESVNGGEDYSGKYIALDADIIINSAEDIKNSKDLREWTPIGTRAHPFRGDFKGQSHTVTGICISNADGNNDGGLFGCIVDAKISLLNLGEGYVDVGGIAGGVAARAESSLLTMCSSLLSVGGNNAGGIVGYAENCRFMSCCSKGAITGDCAGGIVGSLGASYDASVICACFNSGSVTSKNVSEKCAGGIVGALDCGAGMIELTDCLNRGEIAADGSAGGIVGYAFLLGDDGLGKVSLSCSVSTGKCSVGGIIGTDEKVSLFEIRDCFYLDTGSKLKIAGTTAVKESQLSDKSVFSALNGNSWTFGGDKNEIMLARWE